MVDSHYLGYELSWEDSVLDVVDNFIHRVFQRTVLRHPSISQKNCAIKSMLFSISTRKTESPRKKKFFVTFGTCEKIEVKRGHLVKK